MISRRRYQPAYRANPDTAAPTPGRSMPPRLRSLWDKVQSESENYYRSQQAPDPRKIANKTAWRSLQALGYVEGNYKTRENPLPQPVVGLTRFGEEEVSFDRCFNFPKLKAVVGLGKMLEIAFVDRAGKLQVQRFKDRPPDLMWDDDVKTLIVIPSMKVSTACDINTPEVQFPASAVMHRRWSNRDAECARNVEAPVIDGVCAIGIADTIVYRSDKWGKKNRDPYLSGSQEYIHTFDMNVVVYEHGDANASRPDAIVVNGGIMDVIEDGIIY